MYIAASVISAVLAVQAGADSARVDTFRLAPVTVSVTRSATRLSNVPYAVSVIQRDEIARGRATAGLDEALVTVPGVLVSNRYNPAQDHTLSIRGFGARSAFGVRGVKILLDGIPQTLPDGQGQLTNLDLADVARIEVLRGPSSSLYGNASGGVVSLWTDQQPHERLSGRGRVAAGAYGFLKWQGSAATPVGAGSASLSVSETILDSGYRQHSEADTRRLSVRMTYPLAAGTRVTLHGLVADSPWLEDPGAVDTTALKSDSTRRLANPNNRSELEGGTLRPRGAGKEVTQAQGGLALRHDLAGGGSLEVTGFLLRRTLENPIAVTYIEIGRWAYGSRATVSLPGAIGRLPHVFTAGLDAQWMRDDRQNFSPDRPTLPPPRLTRDQLELVNELGPFVQSQIGLGGLASLTVGARYDRVAFRAVDGFLTDGDDSGERVMAAFSASGGVVLEGGPAARPYLNVATSFETPTTTELANRPTGPGGFNPVLEPQRAVNYELGVRGRVSGVGEYAVAAFHADVEDELIPFEVPGDPGRRFFQNAGSARHRGIEAAITLRPFPSLTALTAYSFSDFQFIEFRTATDTLDGRSLPGVPRHYLHWSVRYDGPRGLWLAADNTHASGVYVNDVNTEALRTAPWTSVGLRGGWDGQVGGWRVSPFVAVLNVTDERYAGSVVVNAAFNRYYEPAPPRNAYVGVEIRAAR